MILKFINCLCRICRWFLDFYQILTLLNCSFGLFPESNRLIINKAYVNDTGNYRCTASNSYSSAESSVYISVTGNSPLNLLKYWFVFLFTCFTVIVRDKIKMLQKFNEIVPLLLHDFVYQQWRPKK